MNGTFAQPSSPVLRSVGGASSWFTISSDPGASVSSQRGESFKMV